MKANVAQNGDLKLEFKKTQESQSSTDHQGEITRRTNFKFIQLKTQKTLVACKTNQNPQRQQIKEFTRQIQSMQPTHPQKQKWDRPIKGVEVNEVKIKEHAQKQQTNPNPDDKKSQTNHKTQSNSKRVTPI